MSITKALNSKSNIKQFSNADLPNMPQQPVMARGRQESTLSQTVINLPFSIDTLNNPDALLLTVDGKLLSQGTTYDFTYSSVDAFGFSSQVTLNYTIAAGLNIETIKLGLKKETEFLQDARFNDIYESQDQGFQGFVRTADLMTATATTGTPATGTFHSTIVNRAAIPDMRMDLKARMGIERIMVQSITQLQNEFGSNGEPVYSAVNDTVGQIRFVGAGWVSSTTNIGSVVGNLSTTNLDGFVEITFYGTGINLLTLSNGTVSNYVVSVDGGANSANIFSGGVNSNILLTRNYASNQIINAVSGLALGVHTVKILNAAAGALNLNMSGIEILNESSSITVNPGISYRQGKKATTAAQQLLAYNSSFESGALGTRGGRVVVYQKSDGTLAKAVTPTNPAQALLTSADHTNEEVVRVFYPREFGAGRADDFSSLTASTSNRAFTIDDGTTTLVASSCATGTVGGVEGLRATMTNGSSLIITFVGTGLDIELTDTASGGSDSYTFQIDGATAVSWPYTSGSTVRRVQKLVSGLPYGTHTIKINRVTAATWDPVIFKFIVYQPKKPTVPSGSFELADYNVMANYSASAGSVSDTPSAGVLFKSHLREALYTGTWGTGIGLNSSVMSGFYAGSSTIGDYVEFRFFGSGFEIYAGASGANVTGTLRVDGVAYTGAATVTGGTWVPGTSTATLTIFGNQIQVTGLAMDYHVVRLTVATIPSALFVYGFTSITPIHATKSNLYADLQNTLSVGSNSLSDNRKTSAIKEILPAQKAWAQAVGVASSPTTTALNPGVPMPDMLVSIRTESGTLQISYSVEVSNNTLDGSATVGCRLNGVEIGSRTLEMGAANEARIINHRFNVSVSAGFHKVQLSWQTAPGQTITAFSTLRNLLVEEK